MPLSDSIFAAEAKPSAALPHHSNTRFCDVNIDEYFRPGKNGTAKNLRVCSICKGRMILELLGQLCQLHQSLDPKDIHQSISSFVDGTSTKEKAFENGAWRACGLSEFPKLERCRRPWVRCLRHVAKELGKNIQGTDLKVLDAAMNHDPQTAYEWWKKRNQERATNNRDEPKVAMPSSSKHTAATSITKTTGAVASVKPEGDAQPIDSATKSQSSRNIHSQSIEARHLAGMEHTLLSLINKRNELHDAIKALITAEEARRKVEIDYALSESTYAQLGDTINAGSEAALQSAVTEQNKILAVIQEKRVEVQDMVDHLQSFFSSIAGQA